MASCLPEGILQVKASHLDCFLFTRVIFTALDITSSLPLLVFIPHRLLESFGLLRTIRFQNFKTCRYVPRFGIPARIISISKRQSSAPSKVHVLLDHRWSPCGHYVLPCYFQRHAKTIGGNARCIYLRTFFVLDVGVFPRSQRPELEGI